MLEPPITILVIKIIFKLFLYLFSLKAVVLDRQSKYEEALKYHQKSLAIRIKSLGEEHPKIGDSYYKIGNKNIFKLFLYLFSLKAIVLDKQSKYEEALKYY